MVARTDLFRNIARLGRFVHSRVLLKGRAMQTASLLLAIQNDHHFTLKIEAELIVKPVA